jgi:hypothetical protein
VLTCPTKFASCVFRGCCACKVTHHNTYHSTHHEAPLHTLPPCSVHHTMNHAPRTTHPRTHATNATNATTQPRTTLCTATQHTYNILHTTTSCNTSRASHMQHCTHYNRTLSSHALARFHTLTHSHSQTDPPYGPR